MRKNLLVRQFFFISLLFLAFSCKKAANNLITPANADIKFNTDSNAVSMSLASMTATAIQTHPILSQMNKKAINSTDAPIAKAILDSLAVPDNVNPSYFIFNYVDGGWAIISADKRVEPLLAFSENGTFETSGEIGAGLANWLIVNHKNMQLVKKNRNLKAPKQVEKLWAQLLVNSVKTRRSVNQLEPPPPPCEDSWTEFTVGPLLTTTWDQKYPYNAYCPAGQFDHGHTPVGCVATAMAQIMRFHQYPSTYSWNTMPSIAYSYDAVNGSMAQLMLDAGTSVDMDWNDSGSNPHTSIWHPYGISISAALKNSFGYSSADEASYNPAIVINELQAGRPVLLGASTDDHNFTFVHWYNDGHEWVCDGYLTSTYNICPTPELPNGLGGSYLYLSMNWGWNSQGNGFYSFDHWSVTNNTGTHYYQYHQDMVYNIYP